jgi:hypothetical protein
MDLRQLIYVNGKRSSASQQSMEHTVFGFLVLGRVATLVSTAMSICLSILVLSRAPGCLPD